MSSSPCRMSMPRQSTCRSLRRSCPELASPIQRSSRFVLSRFMGKCWCAFLQEGSHALLLLLSIKLVSKRASFLRQRGLRRCPPRQPDQPLGRPHRVWTGIGDTNRELFNLVDQVTRLMHLIDPVSYTHLTLPTILRVYISV